MDRRDFLKGASTVGAVSSAFAARPGAKMSGRVIGANDRINVGVVGVGGRGAYVANVFAKVGADTGKCQIVQVCDTYQKRVNVNMERHKAKGTLDWREVVNNKDIDAVIVATPDHWHATVAAEAMRMGKDVYCEKPMCHTVDEVKMLIETVKDTKRVMQVGSQTTSGDQWAQAKKYIADGAIGKMLLSQGSYHRNSIEGEWNWPIDKEAGPQGKGENYIDWKTWLGPAQKRDWDPDRFFRFRKYWDYSGGIATDLFFHVVAPMNICWGTPQYPHKVMAGGGIYEFSKLPEDPTKADREVPDTFHLIGEYAAGHSLVLSSSMANSQHIPGLIRGHEGTIIMVEHGRFEGFAPHITLKPEVTGRQGNRKLIGGDKYKFGMDEVKIPVKEVDTMRTHVTNFLDCMVSREKPTLDVETAGKAQVLITMAVQSYRQGKILYFDEQKFKIVDKAPARS